MRVPQRTYDSNQELIWKVRSILPRIQSYYTNWTWWQGIGTRQDTSLQLIYILWRYIQGGVRFDRPTFRGYVVSIRSFQMLVQWMFTAGRVFELEAQDVCLDSVLEFIRLADKCRIKGVESKIAKYIKPIIDNRDLNTTTSCCLPRHIK